MPRWGKTVYECVSERDKESVLFLFLDIIRAWLLFRERVYICKWPMVLDNINNKCRLSSPPPWTRCCSCSCFVIYLFHLFFVLGGLRNSKVRSEHGQLAQNILLDQGNVRAEKSKGSTSRGTPNGEARSTFVARRNCLWAGPALLLSLPSRNTNKLTCARIFQE